MTTVQQFVTGVLKQVLAALDEVARDGNNQGRGVSPHPIVTPIPGQATPHFPNGYGMGVQFAKNDQGQEITGENGSWKYKPHIIMPVEFDIVVTTGSTEKADGSGKIDILNVLSIGGGASEEATAQQTSRVKFRVPLQLPRND